MCVEYGKMGKHFWKWCFMGIWGEKNYVIYSWMDKVAFSVGVVTGFGSIIAGFLFWNRLGSGCASWNRYTLLAVFTNYPQKKKKRTKKKW